MRRKWRAIDRLSDDRLERLISLACRQRRFRLVDDLLYEQRLREGVKYHQWMFWRFQNQAKRARARGEA